MQRRWVVSTEYRAAVNAISNYRKSLGVSQRELARRLEKPPSFVNKIELFERRLDILEFVAICQALEVSPQVLLGLIVERVGDRVPI